LLLCYFVTLLILWSYNQVAKWGVSNFGALSAFDFQPKNADARVKVLNENSKT